MAGNQDALLDGLTKTIETYGKTAIGSAMAPALVIDALNISTSHCEKMKDRAQWVRMMMCFDLVTMSLFLSGVWNNKRMHDIYGLAKLDKYGVVSDADATNKFEARVWGDLTAGGLTELSGKPEPGNIVFGSSSPLDAGSNPGHVGIAAFDGTIANINLEPTDTIARVTLDKFRTHYPHVYQAPPPG